MQVFYNSENVKLNFLSIYVKFFRTDNVIYFFNTLFNTELELCCDNKEIDLLLLELRKGVETNNLLSILKKFSSSNEELYMYMLQKGIIE